MSAPVLVLAAIGFLGVAATAILAVLVIGIRRGRPRPPVQLARLQFRRIRAADSRRRPLPERKRQGGRSQ